MSKILTNICMQLDYSSDQIFKALDEESNPDVNVYNHKNHG